MNSASAQIDLAPRCPLRGFPSGALLAITLLIYLPVILHGGFIWDDPQYIIRNPTLRDMGGLIAIWIHPTSIPQYYPLVHTAFWIEYHLWGLHPAGYHLDNVLLHGLAAILLYRTLQILRIPGAWLAAAIFAVHPINVESVAWATERKNVLSAVFYFSSLIAYLRFVGIRWRLYFLSFLFFVAALLSKSVTCSLPAAIVLLIYWRDGKVPCREFLRLLPFFVVGLAMALLTGWLEKRHVGASGREWSWTFAERCLIAGKALWFYLGKIFWPHPLSFVYPKWPNMSFSQRPELIAYPISFLALLIVLFLARRKIGRGPLVAMLYFSGTLLPALGFVNLYPMRYTFVADHYQYLAAIGIFVPVAAFLSRRLSTQILAAIILCTLAGLTIRRQSVYQSALVLWQDTLTKNPTSFMVWGNLGDEYADLSNDENLPQPDRADARKKARDCYAKLIELAPDQPIAHYKWAIVKEYDGDLLGAQSELQTALDLQPDFTPALDSMGEILMQMQKPDEAMDYFRKAIALDPRFAEVRYHFGYALEQSGQIDEAIEQYATATRLRANYAEAEYNLANLLFVQKGRADLAVPYYSDAVSQHPNRADFRTSFAAALSAVGQNDAAREQCRIALELQPDLAPAKALWQHLSAP
jgi:tetratricopeptide (TPR) repeat protein